MVTSNTVAGDSLTSLWRSAAADGWVPKRLAGPAGDIGIDEVYVTGSADLARRARARGWTVVDLDEEACTLWRRNGAKDLDLLFDRGWAEPVGSFSTLSEVVPEVTTVLSAEAKAQSYVQVVNGLHLRIDEEREAVPCLHWEGVLYLDQT